MKPSIPAALGSMILGAALTVSVADAASVAPRSLALNSAAGTLRLDPAVKDAQGSVNVVVQLSGAPLAAAMGENALREGGAMNRAQQVAYSKQLRAGQDEMVAKVAALGGKETGRVHIAYNAVLVSIDASKLSALSQLPGVTAVQRLNDYQLDLSETVPYIGAAAVQAAGVTGKGVRVAVLDSGIDYTHRNLGGPGTVAAYQGAWGADNADPKNTIPDGFPTAKVIAGYDFVGELWTTGARGTPARTEDPDPIDHGGHGSHVADIIAGRSNDGKHVGVAPDASLIAVKVCSAVTTSCSGDALLLAFDFALDPNGDDVLDDAADVINLSLGSAYGQKEDATAVAAANAARLGVVVVTSAGNSSDKPYDVGSPSMAPEVISVAQTQVPSAQATRSSSTALQRLRHLPQHGHGGLGANHRARHGRRVYVGNTGCNADTYGESAVDRAHRSWHLQRQRESGQGQRGRRTAILIGNNVPGDVVPQRWPMPPPTGTCKPTMVIQQSLSATIKATAGVNATLAVDRPIDLIYGMASTSSRGPSGNYNQIKPDIGAPGASISAEVGTGTGETPFGGTSGAAPMVSGAAALMPEAYPNRTPWAIKSVLMNTAHTDIYTSPATLPGVLAPITRIGGGEVRVDEAVASSVAAWDAERRTGSLSFGYHNVSDTKVLVRSVKVQNYSRAARRFNVSNEFRYADDAASNGVKIFAPSNVFVPPFGSTTFDVTMKIDAQPLISSERRPPGGAARCQSVEYDGHLIRILKTRPPWRRRTDHDLALNATCAPRQNGLALANLSKSLPAAFDIFALTGTSPRLPRSVYEEAAGQEITLHDIAAVGVRVDGPYIQFGVNLYGRKAHPAYPRGIEVDVDINKDGTPDYAIYTEEIGGFDTSGQTGVTVLNLATGAAAIKYYVDADLNSGNIILTAELAQLGLSDGSQISFDTYAYDSYFTGFASDLVKGSVYTIGQPRYKIDPNAQLPLDGVPPRSGLLLKVLGVPGGDTASPSQTGFLLMYRDAADEAQAVNVQSIGRK
jgi:subtilisin family serine protease